MARGGGYRDQCMAENVAWILDHAPKGSKIVLWAHNGHVAKQPGWMALAPGGSLRHRALRRRLRQPHRPVHGHPAWPGPRGR